MQVCVAGGCGFIGSRLCVRVKQKEDLILSIIDKVKLSIFIDKPMIAQVFS